jgi:hypothetical protein
MIHAHTHTRAHTHTPLRTRTPTPIHTHTHMGRPAGTLRSAARKARRKMTMGCGVYKDIKGQIEGHERAHIRTKRAYLGAQKDDHGLWYNKI